MLDPSAFRFPTPRDIERLAFEANASIAEICKRAKVSSQTFRNWKFGRVSPALDTVQRLIEAGAALLAEAQSTSAGPSRSRRKPTDTPVPRAKAKAKTASIARRRQMQRSA